MSEVLTLEPSTDLEIIEDLEFDPELPCERGKLCVANGTVPGTLLIRDLPCPRCGDASNGDFVVCQPCWDAAWRKGLRCRCFHHMPRDVGWGFLRRIV